MKTVTKRLSKTKVIIISALFCAMLLMSAAAYADDYSIVVTKDGSANRGDIEITAGTIDIPIMVSGYKDIYAIQIGLEYDPSKITVDAIEMGDIFGDFGNAVIMNKIDNDAGTVDYMQTLLGKDTGVDNDGTLVTIRITFAEGQFDINNDLALNVKVADSAPAYMDVVIPSFKIIAGVQAADATPTPTLEPVATATIGVVTPAPNSEGGEEFEVAEEKDVDEIMDEIDEMEEQLKATATPVPSNETPEPDSTQVDSDNATEAENISNENEEDNDNKLLSIVLAAVLILLIVGLVVMIMFRVKSRNNSEEE